MLLSASVTQLQCTLFDCYRYCELWNLQLNVRKSNVMVIGRNDDDILPDLYLGPGILGWVKEIKYLGLYLQSRKGLRVNIDSNCRKF